MEQYITFIADTFHVNMHNIIGIEYCCLFSMELNKTAHVSQLVTWNPNSYKIDERHF